MNKSKIQVSGNFNANSTSNLSEMLTEVDENDNVLGPILRLECHNETRKPWHRGAHLYLFDTTGGLYLSQRSLTTDTAPGQWTVSAGGHVKFGSTYERTMQEETQEELDLNIPVELIDKLVIDYGSEREIIGIFVGITDKKPKVNNDKVEQIKLFNLKNLIKEFTDGTFDLSGGSRDSFRYIIENGKIIDYYNEHFKKTDKGI